MKQLKIVIITTLLLILIFILSINTFAASEESFELKLTASTESVNPGQTFSVDIVLDNIKVTTGDLGIGAYSAVIKYDTNILEILNVTAATGWEAMSNEGNIVVNTTNAEVVKEKQNTAKINFKVKETAKLEETEIKIENIEGSTGATTILGKGISTKIIVKEKTTEKPDTEDPNNNNQNPDTEKPNNNNQNPGTEDPDKNNQKPDNNNHGNNNYNTVKGDDNKSQTKLPYAGRNNIFLIIILSLIVITIIIYIKYKRAI